MDIHTRRLTMGTQVAIVAAVGWMPTPANAGWEPLAPTIIDNAGPTGGRPDLVFTIATQGFAAPTKLNGLAYVDATTNDIRYAQRQVEVGDSLATAQWAFEDVGFAFTLPSDVVDWPGLAMDPVSGRPYIAYSANGELWLSTRVGLGGGNCGTGLAWFCESISAACETPVYGVGTPQIEMGGTFGMEADTVHIIDVGSSFLDIRKDLENDAWTCTPVPSDVEPHFSNIDTDSTSIRHEYDDRVKPQVVYNANKTPPNPTIAKHSNLFFRTLFDYDANVPTWSFEHEASVLSRGLFHGMPSVALLDDGLSSYPPSPTGFGVPAIASVGLEFYLVDPNEVVSCLGPGGGTPWDLEYRVATGATGSSWAAPESAYSGEPCWPAMDVGWSGQPYVAFVEQSTGEIMVTTRHAGLGWGSAESVAPTGVMPSIAYDYDNGTIAIAYKDASALEVAVVDGTWSLFGEPVGPYN